MWKIGCAPDHNCRDSDKRAQTLLLSGPRPHDHHRYDTARSDTRADNALETRRQNRAGLKAIFSPRPIISIYTTLTDIGDRIKKMFDEFREKIEKRWARINQRGWSRSQGNRTKILHGIMMAREPHPPIPQPLFPTQAEEKGRSRR